MPSKEKDITDQMVQQPQVQQQKSITNLNNAMSHLPNIPPLISSFINTHRPEVAAALAAPKPNDEIRKVVQSEMPAQENASQRNQTIGFFNDKLLPVSALLENINRYASQAATSIIGGDRATAATELNKADGENKKLALYGATTLTAIEIQRLTLQSVAQQRGISEDEAFKQYGADLQAAARTAGFSEIITPRDLLGPSAMSASLLQQASLQARQTLMELQQATDETERKRLKDELDKHLGDAGVRTIEEKEQIAKDGIAAISKDGELSDGKMSDVISRVIDENNSREEGMRLKLSHTPFAEVLSSNHEGVAEEFAGVSPEVVREFNRKFDSSQYSSAEARSQAAVSLIRQLKS